MKRQFLFVGGALDGTWHWVECPEDFDAPPPKQTRVSLMTPPMPPNYAGMVTTAQLQSFIYLYIATPWVIGDNQCYIYVHESKTVKQALELLITNYRPMGAR